VSNLGQLFFGAERRIKIRVNLLSADLQVLELSQSV
jgi:hypothetical protein